MMDPWSYAAKYKSEHAEQVALFMFCNMVCHFGLTAANDKDSYSVKNHAINILINRGETGQFDDRISQLKYLFAIHNQGNASAIQGARARAEGVRAGVSDICLPVSIQLHDDNPWKDISLEGYGCDILCGLYIELKRPTEFKTGQRGKQVVAKAGGKASTEQEDWQAFLRQQGYVCEICYGWESARDLIISYLKAGGLING